MIDDFYYDGPVAPINEVIPLTGEHDTAQIIISMFYRCATNFYGSSCATYCQERDDERGHYSCTPDGTRLCLTGYVDPMTNCIKPEDGARTEQDPQNPRISMENTVTICVQSDEAITRSISESAKEPSEVLSVADIVVIVNTGMMDVLILVILVLLAVTITKMTHKHHCKNDSQRSKLGTYIHYKSFTVQIGIMISYSRKVSRKKTFMDW